MRKKTSYAKKRRIMQKNTSYYASYHAGLSEIIIFNVIRLLVS